MASTREDSVLVNLRALRGIEEDRRREEDEESRRREQQARQAVEEAERLRRADAERIVREGEEARRRAADEAARLEREGRLRLEETERRARIEASMKLEEARLRMEIEAKAVHGPGKRSVGLIVASVVVLLGAGGIGIFAYQKHLDIERAERLQQHAEAKLAELEVLRTELDRKQAELLTANDKRRQQLEQELEVLRRKEADAVQAAQSAGGKPKPKPTNRPGGKPADQPAAAPNLLGELCKPGEPLCKEKEKGK